MSAGHEDARGHRSSRSWLIAGVIFAVMATAVLVLSTDARWLRLGIVAALWAALLSAFLATHYRRQADRIEDSMVDAQEVYELELEREIAARREYELEIEADARLRAEEHSRAEIDALRGEVATLRATLEKLFGGEVLYERVALTAQSTRMRAFEESKPPPKALPARNGDIPSVITPARENGKPSENGKPAEYAKPREYDKVAEARTELIARVLDPGPRREGPPPRREPEGLSWFSREAKPEPPKPHFVDEVSSGRTRRQTERKPERTTQPHPTESGDLSAALSGGWPSLEPTWEELSRARQEPRQETPSEPVNRTLPAEAQEIQRNAPGGRRRKPEPEEEPARPRARHYKPDPEPEPEPPPPPPSGSHSSGRSVSELLAAYGSDEPRRRRRRDE